jgi:parvulin-like peptidyl-prolyl isomerase
VKQAVEQLRQQGEAVEPSNPLDLRRVRDELVLRKVVDLAVRNSITVGDSEMKRYYEAHRDRFALPDEYTLSQIFIQPRAPDEVAEALAKAREAMNELKHGEKFEEVAARYSDGPNALRGGRLGVVRQGELLPAVERAIASLVPGGVSDIIESPEGFHIIRLEEKSPRQFRPFEEVQFEIQALIFQQKSEDVFQAWLGGLKKKAHIEIKF